MKTAFITLMAVIFIAGIASAQLISYIPSSLPSSQGWTYTYTQSAPDPGETNIYSIDGSTLFQNSIGIGQRTAFYKYFPVIDPSLAYYIDLRARVTMNEIFNSLYPYGFCFGAQIGDVRYVFGITPTAIRYHLGTTAPTIVTLDNTIFHDYRLNIFPGGSWQLFVDGSLAGSAASAWSYSSTSAEVFFGDGTSLSNARAELTRYEFGVVPEPSSVLLLGASLLSLGIAGRLRRIKKSL
jgi:hypothetical protein